MGNTPWGSHLSQLEVDLSDGLALAPPDKSRTDPHCGPPVDLPRADCRSQSAVVFSFVLARCTARLQSTP